MKKVMMIGKSGCGKTTLSQRLCGLQISYKKTQAVEVVGGSILDTPGEYMERKGFYKALIVSAVETDAVLILQACTDGQCSFSPGMGAMFGRPLVGVVTKTDLAASARQIDQAETLLRLAGAEHVFRVGLGGSGPDETALLLDYLSR
ncbi:MAG: EutP/PduV family microcompartment system protein [Oscillospiraceae bacterium]|nr:EutP/PduV family microcompartment system protein [Oscillospiraceae bacterium]